MVVSSIISYYGAALKIGQHRHSQNLVPSTPALSRTVSFPLQEGGGGKPFCEILNNDNEHRERFHLHGDGEKGSNLAWRCSFRGEGAFLHISAHVPPFPFLSDPLKTKVTSLSRLAGMISLAPDALLLTPH